MKKLAILATLAIAGAAYATGPDVDNRTPVNPYGVKPDGTKAQFRMTDAGEALVSGTVAVEGRVVVASADGGIPEVSLGDLLTAENPGAVDLSAGPGTAVDDPIYCVPGDGTAAYSSANPQSIEQFVDGSAVGAANPLPAEIVADGAAVGAANPLPTTPTDALHPAELTVSTNRLFLALPSASALTPTAGQRYRLMARNDYVCIKAGSAPASCEGVPMFAPDAPEAVAFAAIDEAAPDLYFFTPGSAAAIELCPLVEQ